MSAVIAELKTTDEWVDRARAAMSQSTSYLDANFRRQLEENLALFQSRHPAGSKYNTDAYKLRSRLFRPKTRSAVRKTEAAAAAAFFSNEDVVSITAQNDSDPAQQASAEIMKELLQYRLTKTIPWFQVVMGGCQDAQVTGVVCSYQYWEYSEKRSKKQVPIPDPVHGKPYVGADGKPVTEEQEVVEVLTDKPCVELVPLENVRFHPGASWTDPINTSPYVVRLFPMFVQDVKDQMKVRDTKTGMPKWFSYSEGEIMSAISNEFDSTRNARNPQRLDAQGNSVGTAFNDYQIVWVQEHIHRIKGEDTIWYMLGDMLRLSEPKPLSDIYLSGVRPLVMGTMIIETHKTVPPGPVELGKDLQKEANEIANQRIDNVKFVLNKRYIANRNGRVDIRSLVRNVPGSVTLADDPDKDVKELTFPDVTASAYQEQDRLNADFDELIGNFSNSSVNTNRKLNETVGGMSMIMSGASQMTEYGLRVLAETWLEKVLWQLTKLEQAYETNAVIIGIAADKAQIFQKYGINKVTDEMLKNELTLRVNVGMGATNPQFKLQRFLAGMESLSKIAAQPPPGADMEQISKEIFGLLGYKDGARFGFGKDGKKEDPKLAQAMQTMQEMAKIIDDKKIEANAKIEEAKQLEIIRQDGEAKRQAQKLEGELRLEEMKLNKTSELKQKELATNSETEKRGQDITLAAARADSENGSLTELATLHAKNAAMEVALKEAKDRPEPEAKTDPALAKALADIAKALEQLSAKPAPSKEIKVTMSNGRKVSGKIEGQ